jgi:carbamoyltransferase
MHQIDSTLRAQVVDKQTSPEYYNILCEFEKITGIGGMLNTSLNIHGKPIVHKPIDVINEILTHDLVELKYVVFDNVLLKHKGEI